MLQGGANQDIQRFPPWVDGYMTLLVDPSFERFRKSVLFYFQGALKIVSSISALRCIPVSWIMA